MRLRGEAAIRYGEKHGVALEKYMGKKKPAELISASDARKENPKVIFVEVFKAAGPADLGMSVQEFLARRSAAPRWLPDYSDMSAPTIRAMTVVEMQGRRREALTKPYLKEKP